MLLCCLQYKKKELALRKQYSVQGKPAAEKINPTFTEVGAEI